ncbi:NAD-dependent epimerase/dehydratase family protein [Patescibacteria group bacterium]
MKSKKILITGGAGFIGRHLLTQLSELGHQLAVIDNLSVGRKNHLPKNTQLFKAHIQDKSIVNIFKKFKPEVVIHLAADNRVTSSPEETIQANVIGTFNVLKSAQVVKAKQLIFTSSAAVYGESKNLPIKETHPTKPISAYGVSKLTGELYCQQFQPYFKTSIFRFANVYGPGQSSSSEGGVVAIFIDKLLKNQKPIIYGNGQQTRDFIFVKDVVDALLLSLKSPQNHILNIGSNQPTSIIHLLELTAELINKKPNFIKKPARPIEIEKSLFSHDLATKTLGWQPKTSLESGLIQTIDYFKNL